MIDQRVVVVSGGGSGIGRAIAERFAADGDAVVIVGRRLDVLRQAADAITGSVTPFAADLTEPGSVEELAEEVRSRFGRVDVLVNNAGGNAVFGAPDGATDGVAGAAWHWLGNFKANTLTAVLLTEGLRDLIASNGRVLFLSSIAAYRGSGSGSYAASKAALHPYAFDLAAALGPRGITVNVVAPGYIAGTEFFPGGVSAERERMLIEQTANKRAGVATDLAETVYWLASPGAGHVTAQILQVNGGAERGR